MAVTAAHLTAGTDSVAGTTAATASISPGANKLILVSVGVYDSDGTPSISSVVGNGITYDLVRTSASIDDGFGPYFVAVYRGLAASPSSGAITITVSTTTSQVDWSVDEFDGVDTGGTNGSAAVVQSAANTGNEVSSLTVTLAAFADAGNATFGTAISYNNTPTSGTGFTELGVSTSGQLNAQWRADNDTSVDWSFDAGDDAAGVALEIAAAGGGGGGTMLPMQNAQYYQ